MASIAAQKAGMSYGQWMAMNYNPIKVVLPNREVQRPCRVCGNEIPPWAHKSTLYCTPECYYEAKKTKARERYWRNKERVMTDGKI